MLGTQRATVQMDMDAITGTKTMVESHALQHQNLQYRKIILLKSVGIQGVFRCHM
jgi:hypothetical protein